MPSMKAIAEFHGVDPTVCFRCQAIARTEKAHVIDRTGGGLDDVQNLRPICFSCHASQPSFVNGEERRALLWFEHADWINYAVACARIILDEGDFAPGDDFDRSLIDALVRAGLTAPSTAALAKALHTRPDVLFKYEVAA